MHRLMLAVRAFFKILGSRNFAERVEAVLQAKEPRTKLDGEPKSAPVAASRTTSQTATRSEALTLLATLQREARLVDLIMEPLDSYSDAQVGGAARSVLKDSRSVIDRLFALMPAQNEAEGAEIAIPRDYDVGLLRLTGKLAASPPPQGRLVHPGWRASKCEIPQWSGSREAGMVVMPAEVEVV